MSNLENMLEISTAIRNQKKGRWQGRNNSLLRLVNNFLENRESPSDLISKIKEAETDETLSLHKISEELFWQNSKKFEGKEERAYGIFQQFSEYISKVMDKMYRYYSSVKDAFEAIKDALKVGYTDKLLKEMEDWGYFHFKTVFRKLNRLTPLGAASYYLQELYVAMVKPIKH